MGVRLRGFIFRQEESRGFHQDCLSPLGMEAECEKLHQVVCYRPKDETGGLDLEGRKESEDLKLAYLPLTGWLAYLLLCQA